MARPPETAPESADAEKTPRFSEPLIVPCLFLTGYALESTEAFIRIVGWVDLPIVGDLEPERRIISRVVMPLGVAKALQRSLRERLLDGDG